MHSLLTSVVRNCSFGRVLMDGEEDSGSTAEINQNLSADKSGSNPCCSDEPQDNEKDIQDSSVKQFLPFSTFCKIGNMKNDSVVKSDKKTETLGLEQHYSKTEDDLSADVVEDGKPKTLAALFSIQHTDHRDSISSSGHLTAPRSASFYDSMSFRSNSTTSTRSFAFPVLTSDWNGSPVRMVDGDRRFSKKRRHWRMCFGCYNV